MDYLKRKVKGQFKQADRLHAKYTVVLGSNEIETNQVKLKEMATGNETELSLENMTAYIKERR